jgi:hypothetical protein
MPMLRRYGLLRVRLRPSSSIVPLDGFSKPAIINSVVVLPEPLGPRKVTNSPRATSIDTSSTALVLPSYDFTTLRSRR